MIKIDQISSEKPVLSSPEIFLDLKEDPSVLQNLHLPNNHPNISTKTPEQPKRAELQANWPCAVLGRPERERSIQLGFWRKLEFATSCGVHCYFKGPSRRALVKSMMQTLGNSTVKQWVRTECP